MCDFCGLDVFMWDELNNIYSIWEIVWYGICYRYLELIIDKGFLFFGFSGIKLVKGYYKFGEMYFGIWDWVVVIFFLLSIFYVFYVCYFEWIFFEF